MYTVNNMQDNRQIPLLILLLKSFGDLILMILL